MEQIEFFPAFLTGTHHYSFRVGEAAEIVGVKFAKPKNLSIRACYHIRFKDGVEDYVAIREDDNYIISTGPIIIKQND